MRKIDADELIKEFLKWFIPQGFEETERDYWTNEMMGQIVDSIDAQPTVDDWIPIEKKQPPVCEDVLVTAYVKVIGGKRKGELTKIRAEGVLNWYGKWELSGPINWADYASPENEVIAWQPLPEEYEVGARWK